MRRGKEGLGPSTVQIPGVTQWLLEQWQPRRPSWGRRTTGGSAEMGRKKGRAWAPELQDQAPACPLTPVGLSAGPSPSLGLNFPLCKTGVMTLHWNGNGCANRNEWCTMNERVSDEQVRGFTLSPGRQLTRGWPGLPSSPGLLVIYFWLIKW